MREGVGRRVQHQVSHPGGIFCGQRQSHGPAMRSRQKVRAADRRSIHELHQPVGLGLERGVDPRHTFRLADAECVHGVDGGFPGKAGDGQLPGGSSAQEAMEQNKLWSRPGLETVHPVSLHLDPVLFNLDAPESVQHPAGQCHVASCLQRYPACSLVGTHQQEKCTRRWIHLRNSHSIQITEEHNGAAKLPANRTVPGRFMPCLCRRGRPAGPLHNFPKIGLVDMSGHIRLVENSRPRIAGSD